MIHAPRANQQGSLLIAVVVVLAVLAAIALMLSTSTSSDNALVENHAEGATLDYVAESGLEHAKWQLAQNTTCAAYTDLPATPFGAHSYSAAFAPGNGSPITVTATGTLQNGNSRSLTRDGVRLYQAPTVVTLQPGAEGIDAYLRDGGNSDNNFGAASIINIEDGDKRSGLLKFDLSAIPASADILSAVLELKLKGGNNVSAGVIDAHRVTQSWVEGDEDGNSPPAGGGATYNQYDGATDWATPGGDYDATVLDSVTINSLTPSWYAWDLTTAAQGWVTVAQSNFGVILRASSGNVDKLEFFSSDDSITAVRPRLTITYACECGASGTAGSTTLQPGTEGKDTFLSSFRSNSSYGGDSVVTVALSSAKNGLFEFDLSSIPAAASIDSATLSLYASSNSNTATVGAHRVTTAWLEGTTSAPSASTDGASWNSYDAVNSWSSAGGDYAGVPESSTSISGSGVWYDWDISAAATLWHGDSTQNHGLAMVATGSSFNVGFVSSDNSNASQHPRLTVNYTCPCGVDCGGGGGGGGSGGSSTIILSTETGATLGGLTFTGNDIAEYDPDSDAATLFLDGSLVGMSDLIDAVHMLENGNIVLSTTADTSFAGLTFAKEDLVEYDPVAGTATMYLEANVHFSDPENVISVHVLNNGNTVLSTDSGATLGGLSFSDIDLVEYNRSTGAASIFFDGDATSLSQEIRALHILDNGNIVFAPDADTTLGGLTFGRDQLVEYDPIADTATLYFDGEALFSDTTERIWSLHIGPGSGADGGSGSGGGPIAHWKLDDGAGTTAIDSEGGHDGTLTNGPVWVAGQLGGALDFDGSNDYVDLTSDAELDDVFDGGATVAMWIYPRSWGKSDNGRILDKASQVSGDRDGWMIALRGETPAVQFAQGFTGVRGFWRSQEGTVALDTWTHVAVVYDASSVANDAEIYLNGVSQSPLVEIAPTGSIATDAGIALRMGNYAQDTSRTFDGIIDDVRIYDRMLSPEEIGQQASAGQESGGSGNTDGGDTCNATFVDQFNAENYSGSDGTESWSTSWLEINESDGPTEGDERVVDEDSDYHLQVRDNDGGGEGVQREADLSGYTSAILSLGYRRDGFDNDNDWVTIDVSDDGGATWQELLKVFGSGTDSSYVSWSTDITGHIAANTRIRFLTSPNLGKGDEFYVDNVAITASGCAN